MADPNTPILEIDDLKQHLQNEYANLQKQMIEVQQQVQHHAQQLEVRRNQGRVLEGAMAEIQAIATKLNMTVADLKKD